MYIPPPPSPEAEELGGHLTDLINAYQADHPYMTPLEVQQAVKLARGAVPGGSKMVIKAVLVGMVVMLALVAFLFVSAAPPQG